MNHKILIVEDEPKLREVLCDFFSSKGEHPFEARDGMEALALIEEQDFDNFIDKLKDLDVEFVHPFIEHSWGQRVVRLYDPDRHIIEIGEDMKVVCRRFLDSGMTPEEVAKRMDAPMKFINACMRG